jgi:catechol 2,3-dioxygenase-like lactoylglutathione lyase family enzyme
VANLLLPEAGPDEEFLLLPPVKQGSLAMELPPLFRVAHGQDRLGESQQFLQFRKEVSMMSRFHHIHLICSDLKQSETFFTEVLGAKFVRRQKFGKGDGVVIDFTGTPVFLRSPMADENIPDDAVQKRFGYDHIGVEVENVNALYDELRTKGLTFASPPTDVKGGRIAFLRGPDNITVELYERLAP